MSRVMENNGQNTELYYYIVYIQNSMCKLAVSKTNVKNCIRFFRRSRKFCSVIYCAIFLHRTSEEIACANWQFQTKRKNFNRSSRRSPKFCSVTPFIKSADWYKTLSFFTINNIQHSTQTTSTTPIYRNTTNK